MFKPKTNTSAIALALAALATSISLTVPPASADTAAIAERIAKTQIDVATVDTENASLSDAEIRAIISAALLDQDSQLARLSAARISIPEIKVTLPRPTKKAQPNTITYTDVVLTNISNGVAENLTIGEMTITSKAGNGTLQDVTLNAVNLANWSRVVTPSAAPDDEFYPLYSALNIASGSFTSSDVACSIGAISGSDYKMRRVGAAAASLAEALKDSRFDDDPITVLAPFLTSYTTLVTSVQTGPSEALNLECANGPDVASDARDTSFAIGHIQSDKIEPGLYPRIELHQIQAQFDTKSHLEIEQATIKPVDFNPMLAALQNAPQPITEQWLNDNTRLLTPDFTGFTLSGVDVSIDDKGTEVPFSIANVDLSLGDFLNGMPTRAEFSGTNIVFEIPEDDSDRMLVMMRNSGLTTFDGSLRFAAHWTAADQAITLEEASAEIKNFGQVRLDSLLINASDKLFDPDYRIAGQALEALALKNINLAVTDNGMGDVAIAATGMSRYADVKTVRPIYADLVKGTIIAYLADLADAANLGDVISSFVAGTTKSLNISVTAKSDEGINLDGFQAAEDDPKSILAKLNISATAE